MGLVAQPADYKRELAPAGTRLGCCISVVDIGSQYSEKYHKTRPQIFIAWELVGTKMKEGDNEGKPFIISKMYGNTTGQGSHLVAHYSWAGAEEDKPFDVSELLGKYALISIVHNTEGDKTYANINSVSDLPEEMETMKKPEPQNEAILFDIDAYAKKNKGALAVYEKLYDFLKERIDKAVEVTGVDPANEPKEDTKQDGPKDMEPPPPELDDIPM